MQITNETNIIFENETSKISKGNTGQAYTDGKIHSDVPLVTIKSKPSCGCSHGYYWHTQTFENYCPNCHRYGTLHNTHKSQSRYEQELTCSHCDSDFCGVCGKEKYSWSHKRLIKKTKNVVYHGAKTHV